MGLRLKVEIVEMKEFHAKILLLVQPFSTHEHLAPKFGRAANFFRFYIIKIAKVGLRMKVEIVEMTVFYDARAANFFSDFISSKLPKWAIE